VIFDTRDKMEQTNKTKRNDEEASTTMGIVDPDPTGEQPATRETKKAKRDLTEEEDAERRRAALDAAVQEVRSDSQEKVRLYMIAFFQRCHPALYVDEQQLPPRWQRERWGIQGVTLGLVQQEACNCASFYDVAADASEAEKEQACKQLYQDYRLCASFGCDLHTFHTVACFWSSAPGQLQGGFQQCVLFHALRHHIAAAQVQLQPVLLRLMELAVGYQRSYEATYRPRCQIKRVPDFAKVMLAVMHYSDVHLMRQDPADDASKPPYALCDNIKKPDAFSDLVRHSLFPDHSYTSFLQERTDSLRLVAEEARRLIVQRYNAKDSRYLSVNKKTEAAPIGIVRLQPGTQASAAFYTIPDMRWF
jgi:hypothetical protein